MNHTKEPWFMTDADDSDVCIFGGDKKEWLANIGLDIPVDIAEQNLSIVFDLEKANARRIVACVNACEGLTQDHFDGGWKARELIAYASNLEKERDAYRDMCAELLNAAKNYLPHMPISSVKEGGANRFSGMLKASDDLKDAITKAEQLLGEKK